MSLNEKVEFPLPEVSAKDIKVFSKRRSWLTPLFYLIGGIFFINCSISLVYGSGAEEKKAETGSGKKEEGAGAGPSKTIEAPEWMELQNKLSSLGARIQATEGNIEKLLEMKQKMKNDSKELKEVVDELILQHKELRRLIEENSQISTRLKFRFPDRGMKQEDRFYEKHEVKSLNEMETNFNTNARLKRNFDFMKHQYGEDKLIDKEATPKSKKSTNILEDPSVILRK